jgi:rare lipoprotein A
MLFLVMMITACGGRKVQTKVPAGPVAVKAGAVKAVRAGDRETGLASWYGEPYHGRRAANGEIYDMNQLTAAHRTMPFETAVRVTNLRNGREVDVRITDRGPFVEGRIIDLSLAAAQAIDMVTEGVGKVELRVLEAPERNQEPARERGAWSVQVAALRDREAAERLRDELRARYGDVRLVETEAGLIRVLVGSWKQTQAEGYRTELAQRFQGAFTVRAN